MTSYDGHESNDSTITPYSSYMDKIFYSDEDKESKYKKSKKLLRTIQFAEERRRSRGMQRR
jgi:hypothetical protein